MRRAFCKITAPAIPVPAPVDHARQIDRVEAVNRRLDSLRRRVDVIQHNL